MRPPVHRRRSDAFENSMTPMIDVVFLLLVFFVCAAATQVREALLPADLPSGALAAHAVAPEKPILGEVWVKLSTSPTGKVRAELNDTVYEDLTLLEGQLLELAKLAPEIPVILDIEPDVEVGDMIRIYDACRAARFEAIHFAIDTNARRPKDNTAPDSPLPLRERGRG